MAQRVLPRGSRRVRQWRDSQSPNYDMPIRRTRSSFPPGANWYAGNYHDGTGQYHVNEAFLETNVPFIDSPSLGKANMNAGGPLDRLFDFGHGV